jgi:hypothetical protein
MKTGISQLLDHLIRIIPGMITVVIYAVMVIILEDFQVSILLLIGGLLMGLVLSAMDVNFLPLRPLIVIYTLAAVCSFFFIVYKSDLLTFGLEGLIVVSFFIIAILVMLLLAMTRPDHPSTYILKVILDWYGVILLFVFLFTLYYYVCNALVDVNNAQVDVNGKLQNGLQTCCYFSCVTFTGLGYGDVVTRPEFRMVAAMETIIGYICMGGVAATIYSLIQSKLQAIHKAERLHEKEQAEQ